MNHNIVCIKQKVTQNDCESLDLVMALASFDYRIHLVFYGDAVSDLWNSDIESIYYKRLQALPLFDVNDIYVAEMSSKTRELDSALLPNNIQLLTSEKLKQLLNASLAVYTL